MFSQHRKDSDMDSQNDVSLTKVEVLGTKPQVEDCSIILREIMKVSSHGRHPKLHDAAKLIIDVIEESGFHPESENQLHFILPRDDMTPGAGEPFDLSLG